MLGPDELCQPVDGAVQRREHLRAKFLHAQSLVELYLPKYHGNLDEYLVPKYR